MSAFGLREADMTPYGGGTAARLLTWCAHRTHSNGKSVRAVRSSPVLEGLTLNYEGRAFGIKYKFDRSFWRYTACGERGLMCYE